MYIPSIPHFLTSITLQQWFYLIVGLTVLIASAFLQKTLKRVIVDLAFPSSYHSILVTIFGNLTKIACFFVALLILDEVEGINVTSVMRGFLFFSLGAGFILNDLIIDFAAGFFILYYKPFKAGQWLTVRLSDSNRFTGKITAIDIRYTTLHNDKDTVLLPNSFVFKSPLCIAHASDPTVVEPIQTSCKVN